MWTGYKPSIGHIRVFGCVAHVKVVSGHLQKLDSRSKLLVHLGVETGTKAYRLFDPDTGIIRVSRDVFFDEERPWQWGKSEKFKGTPGATLTIEGFIPQDDREDDNMESQTGLEFPAQGTDEHYETNSEDESVTPISSDGSAGSISSLTGGGAPKRCRTLTELYDETNEVLLLNDGEEPTSYSMACKRDEWKKAMKTELDSI
ncbi:zinc finger, CCHC-type containing protein [Tanacetum coccineum]